MSFDDIIDRGGKWSSKWGMASQYAGVEADGLIPMWVADSDFRCAEFILDAAREWIGVGAFGYAGDNSAMFNAIQWWMKEQHGWAVEPDWMTPMHGLGNAIATAIHAFSEPGEGVVIFTPVYHEFANKINRTERRVAECPLVETNGRYSLDFDAYDALMQGDERILLWCSPHNPVGRVWTAEEIRGVCDFARRHDLILVSDEIHQDIVFEGHRHIPTAVADPSIRDRLITTVAASKTFNVAGMRVGNVIIEDTDLRAKYNKLVASLDIQPNTMGVAMTAAAYSPEGAAWSKQQNEYVFKNFLLLQEGLSAIPGFKVPDIEGTYLAWVDYRGTGMSEVEVLDRVQGTARIVPSRGTPFGTGGDGFLRFNLATPRSNVAEAVKRIQAAFDDLQ